MCSSIGKELTKLSEDLEAAGKLVTDRANYSVLHHHCLHMGIPHKTSLKRGQIYSKFPTQHLDRS